jgi:phage baseplate assembly protein W
MATYLDLNTEVGQDVKNELVADIDAVNNSLSNLFNCAIGSRPFAREYGSYLLYFLFEPCDQMTASQLRSSLLQSIERWEPRIVVDPATSVTPLAANDGFLVQVFYYVKALNTQGSYTFEARRLNS